MPTRTVPPRAHRTSTDDDAFVARVEAACGAIQSLHLPDGLRLVHVNNWFGPRWLGFSGKILGAAGKWSDIENPTLPPFVPNRVLAEQLWVRDAGCRYHPSRVTANLHVAQEGSANTYRYAARIVPGIALVWFSANTAVNRRGAMMAYVPSGRTYLAWYVGFELDDCWRVCETRGTSRREFERLLSFGDTGAGAPAGG